MLGSSLSNCGLRLNCHVTQVTVVVCSSEYTSTNLVKSSLYKCFFEPFSSAEAHILASLSYNVGRGKPLKENRGERWSFMLTESPNMLCSPRVKLSLWPFCGWIPGPTKAIWASLE